MYRALEVTSTAARGGGTWGSWQQQGIARAGRWSACWALSPSLLQLLIARLRLVHRGRAHCGL